MADRNESFALSPAIAAPGLHARHIQELHIFQRTHYHSLFKASNVSGLLTTAAPLPPPQAPAAQAPAVQDQVLPAPAPPLVPAAPAPVPSALAPAPPLVSAAPAPVPSAPARTSPGARCSGSDPRCSGSGPRCCREPGHNNGSASPSGDVSSRISACHRIFSAASRRCSSPAARGRFPHFSRCTADSTCYLYLVPPIQNANAAAPDPQGLAILLNPPLGNLPAGVVPPVPNNVTHVPQNAPVPQNQMLALAILLLWPLAASHRVRLYFLLSVIEMEISVENKTFTFLSLATFALAIISGSHAVARLQPPQRYAPAGIAPLLLRPEQSAFQLSRDGQGRRRLHVSAKLRFLRLRYSFEDMTFTVKSVAVSTFLVGAGLFFGLGPVLPSLT